MNIPKDSIQRHNFAKAGCTYHEFAARFQVGYKGAERWMRRNEYKPSIAQTTRGEEDMSPRTIVGAYYALLASILLGWTSRRALRKIAQ